MAQTGYTPIQLYYSSTASAAPIAGNLAAGELAINTNDGKLYYKDSGGVVQLIASKAGSSGDVVGPASATDGNLAAFDGATGKLIKQAATVTAAQGGTGQSSYTVGDLVYASGATTLAKLADVATGNALISGGVGVAPSYGKIGLTTHVSGTLPEANGGTGITSLGTGVATWLGTPSSANLAAAVTDETGSGALVFANSPTLGAFNATGNVNLDGGTFTFNDSAADRDARFEGLTDPNLLFLDASTNRIGIGTNAPSVRLNLSGSATNDVSVTLSNTSTSTSTAQITQLIFNRTQTVSNSLQFIGRLSFTHNLTDSSSATEGTIYVAGSNVAGSNKGNIYLDASGGHVFLADSTAYGAPVSDTAAVCVIDTNNVAAAHNAKLGYYGSSGGAVTQTTSRTTGVTLDNTNGAITLVSAAGTTTWQSFTVTNNKVAATDVVYVCQKSGADLNEIHVTNVSAGSFQISFRTTGGTTTEQPVFNFVVLGAVTS